MEKRLGRARLCFGLAGVLVATSAVTTSARAGCCEPEPAITNAYCISQWRCVNGGLNDSASTISVPPLALQEVGSQLCPNCIPCVVDIDDDCGVDGSITVTDSATVSVSGGIGAGAVINNLLLGYLHPTFRVDLQFQLGYSNTTSVSLTDTFHCGGDVARCEIVRFRQYIGAGSATVNLAWYGQWQYRITGYWPQTPDEERANCAPMADWVNHGAPCGIFGTANLVATDQELSGECQPEWVGSCPNCNPFCDNVPPQLPPGGNQ